MAGAFTGWPFSTGVAAIAWSGRFLRRWNVTADARFRLEKEIEHALATAIAPGAYTSRYALITHSLVPYRVCQAAGQVQSRILAELSEGIASVDELDAERVEGFQRVTRSFSSRGAAERRDDADGVVLPLVCDI